MKTHLVKQTLIGMTVACILISGIVIPVAADDFARGAEIFAANCATCHGPAGSPDPDSPLVQSLGVMPANFSDSLFNSREPASTWKMVVTYGGPEMGFSEMMPAFGESLSEQDIDNVLAYIKTLGGEHDCKNAVQWSVLPQARIGLNRRGNIALNAGVELPLNDRDGRYDWRAYVYFIWDFADGGLFEGW